MSKPKMADADDGLFKPGSKLRHLKTGGFYKIVLLANIEATLEPAYVYESMQTHDFWIRPKAEMEDGRFELVDNNNEEFAMTEDRITNLEIKISFTEDLIEQLNQTVYKQQQQIEFLYRELKSIKEQAGSSDQSGARNLKDEIPPHY
jgi:uncharacterized coiled-coil protein SlyX